MKVTLKVTFSLKIHHGKKFNIYKKLNRFVKMVFNTIYFFLFKRKKKRKRIYHYRFQHLKLHPSGTGAKLLIGGSILLLNRRIEQLKLTAIEASPPS